MKYFILFFLVWFFIVASLTSHASLFAQVFGKKALISTKAAIFSLTPSTIGLQPGGQSAIVTVEGQYLESVLNMEVIREGRGVREITVKMIQPWPISRKIEFQAGKYAISAKGYQLRVIGKAEMREFKIDVPLSVFSLEVLEEPKRSLQRAETTLPSRTITQGGTIVAPNLILPDLIIQAIRIDPPNPNNGGLGFLVYATIKNKGNREAFLPRGWNLADSKFSGWRPNDFYGFPPQDNTTLSPDAAIEILVYNYRNAEKSPAGTWTVTVRADPDKQIMESNEGNNEKSVQLTVTDVNPSPPSAPGDLIITSLWLEPAEATIAGNFKLVAIIKNQGSTAVKLGVGYPILSEQGDHLKYEQIWDDVPLQPGETRTFRCTPQKLQVGTSIWTVIVDPMNKVGELDETNNKKTIEVRVK